MAKIATLFFWLLLAATPMVAQLGSISGFINDENGLGMPGATIYIANLNQGTVTDVQGRFLMTSVPTGKHKLEVSYIGYESSVLEVEVQEGQTTTAQARLRPGVITGSAVLVIGDRIKGQAKALNQQRSNANITNIVAADQIGRFPDANIGDALKRIPGITVINDQGEARFGLIRGTEPRFNSVTINGERVPSAESSTRTVQLDLIPSDMIQTIEVSKALTADMDADAIGGTANLVTRAAPSDLRLSGTLGSGYNFLSGKPMAIASLIAGKRFFDDKLGIIASASFLDHRFGSDNVEFEWDRTIDGTPFLTNAQVRKYDVQRIRRSASLSLDYRLGKASTIFFRSMYNLRDDYENRFRLVYSGLSAPNADGLTRGRVELEIKGGGEDQKFTRLERQSTTTNTLSGDHLLGKKIRFDWSATHAYASEDRPNERYISFRSANLPLASGLRPNTSNPEFAFVTTSQALDVTTLPFRRFQLRNDFTDEQDLNGRFNFSIPLAVSGDFANTLKVGGVLRTKTKLLRRDRGSFLPSSPVAFTDFPVEDYTDAGYLANGGGTNYAVGQFPVPQSLEGFENRFAATYEANDAGNQQASFDGNENIGGGYVMFTQNLGDKFLAIAGVRVENTNVAYNATQFDQEGTASAVSGKNTYTNVMPSLHLKYDLNDRTILRAAWTNTLARPNYEDLSPSRLIDVSENTLFSGNPSLNPTTSMNLDLMAEHYFKSVGILSAGLFYKNIDDFIYTTSSQNFFDPISGNTFLRATTPLNGPAASLTGFEFAFQRQLDFLPGFLKYLGIYANYTFSDSKADVLFYDEDEDVNTRVSTTLPGTAKHNINGSLSFDNKRLQMRVSLNYHSGFLDPDDTFIALTTAGTTDSRFLDQQMHVDANFSYAFSPQWRVFVEANNLTNQPLRYYQGVRERTMQAEYYNARVQLGIKFDLFKVTE